MGFFKDMVKSREEWLKKPNIFPRLNYPYSSRKDLNTNSTSNNSSVPSPSPSPIPVSYTHLTLPTKA